MADPLFIAVDLGAGSGRVFICGVGPDELFLEEVRRFQYPPIERSGVLRWDFVHILAEIKLGLRSAGDRARQLHRSIQSIGVDSWGVDYGLLDADGVLINDPACYRDDRTLSAVDEVFERVPRSEIFENTGIQFQCFNTLFQLYSENGDIHSAAKFLLLPDLINYFLTGTAAGEYTNVTTTQMYNAVSGTWDRGLLERLDLPIEILPEIIPAGTNIGPLRSEIGDEVGLSGINVVAPGTHDTASAVAAAPLDNGSAFISSGTWSLIGVENKNAIINEAVEKQNFTNEGGVYGTIRFLKNVMGLWIFESCRREWKASGIDVEYDTILRDVEAANGNQAFIFPDDERFLNPPKMLSAITQQLKDTGQKLDDAPAAISRMIFDSLALRYASVLKSIGSLTGRAIDNIQILGGGGRNRYLNQMTANASGLRVRSGLVEATVVGNVLVQAIHSGRFASLAEARKHVFDNQIFEEYLPVTSPNLVEAIQRYSEIESRFTDRGESL